MDEDLVAMGIFALMVVGMLGIAYVILVMEIRQNAMKHAERRMIIERGLVPPEEPPKKKALTPDDYLRRGLLLLFLGVGLGVTPPLLLDVGPGSFGRSMAVAGIVLGFLGAGNLAYYRLHRTRDPVGSGV